MQSWKITSSKASLSRQIKTLWRNKLKNKWENMNFVKDVYTMVTVHKTWYFHAFTKCGFNWNAIKQKIDASYGSQITRKHQMYILTINEKQEIRSVIPVTILQDTKCVDSLHSRLANAFLFRTYTNRNRLQYQMQYQGCSESTKQISYEQPGIPTSVIFGAIAVK